MEWCLICSGFTQVVIGIIRTCGPALMRSNDMERMVQYIKVGVPRWRHATLQVGLLSAAHTSVPSLVPV